jgi:hypothetical protein
MGQFTLLPKERLMADDNTKNPNVKQPGENPEGKFHFQSRKYGREEARRSGADC